MTEKFSRRSLLRLDRSETARPLDRFYDSRSGASTQGPRPKVPEELHGPVEASRIGLGDPTEKVENPEDIPLPDLQDQEIDEATLRQLVFDIENAAELLDIRLKGGAAMHAVRATPSLSEAITALTQRRVSAIQLRYRYRGKQWWDTLLLTERGLRIVRIEQPFR